MRIDKVTKRWMRNESDERATFNGCRFDEARGQLVIDFAVNNCVLYEGEHAGEPLIPHDWQVEATMRMFGWVRMSERWNRMIRRFTQASFWTGKKNKKTPTLAWWGLYLLTADGEWGQHCFSIAKDGTQARIPHQHAVEMVRQSPTLRAECTINKNTLQITHERTRSTYSILTSDDARSQAAKEGINGSLLVDECHVVDRALMRRVRRAGASRSEPLHIEVSTAGKDPDSYGKERYDYGKQVESGAVDNEQLLFISYEAPQDLSDADLAKDPVKYGKMANPAWGHTISEEEYLQDYNQSKRSIIELADFKMYRLDIWQQSVVTWLRVDDWSGCRRDYTEQDFEGQTCDAGLDLSKTRDMTAFVMVFGEGDEEEEEFAQLPFFWMPEEEAKRKSDLAPFLQWAHDGWLKLTPGNVVDYRIVRRDIAALSERFNIRRIMFDKTYAEELTQTLEEENGIARVEFDQNMMSFAGPTAAYERLIISGKLHHNGNPILTWQAGHAKAKSDSNGNKRPVKPTPDDPKKIDGIVGGIMGLAGAMEGGEEESVYEHRGVIAL